MVAAEDGPSPGQPMEQPSAAPVEQPAEQQQQGSEPSSLTEEQQKAVEFLHALLDNINKSDTTGIFHYPVDGTVVPGYYDRIKQPMCFMVMRDKVRARSYRTWRAFVADFEFICSNARTFNPKAHRVHKMAVAMQQKGRKLMETSQLQGRRCIHLLHPEGAAVAAAEEAADLMQHKEEPASSSALGTGTTSAGPGDGEEGEAGVVNGRQHVPPPPPPDEDFSTAGRVWDVSGVPTSATGSAVAWGALFREASSLSGSQQQQQPVFGAVAAPAHIASLIAALSSQPAVVFQPYAAALAAVPASAMQTSAGTVPAVPAAAAAAAAAGSQPMPAAAPPEAGVMAGLASTSATAEGTAAAAAVADGPEPSAPARFGPSGRTRQWKAERRSVEWRARWLELRMRELKSIIGALQPDALDAAPAAAPHLPQQQQSLQQQVQQPGSQPQKQQHQAAALSCRAQPHGYLLAQQLELVPGASVAQAPFFARPELRSAPAGMPSAADPARQQQRSQQQQESTRPPPEAAQTTTAATEAAGLAVSAPAGPTPLPAPPTAPATLELDECEPARVFTMLDLVERQLCDMRTRLATTFNIPEAAPAAAARFGAQGMARAAGGGAGGSGSKRMGLQRQTSARQLQRDGSMSSSLNKRRRLEDDIVVSPTAGTPHNRLLERTVSVIAIPPVRELPPAELKARSKATGLSWRHPGSRPTKGSGSRGGRGGSSAGRGATAGAAPGSRALSDHVPPEVAEVLAGLDEGSSSEDTSDEAFAERHRFMEEEERLRFAGQLGGARRKPNKAGKQAAKNAGKAAAKPVGRPKAKPTAKQAKVQQQQQQQGLQAPAAQQEQQQGQVQQDAAAQQMPPPPQQPPSRPQAEPSAVAQGPPGTGSPAKAAAAAASKAATDIPSPKMAAAAAQATAGSAAAARKSLSASPKAAPLSIKVPGQQEPSGPDSGGTRPSPSRSSARVAAAVAASAKASKGTRGGGTPRGPAGGAGAAAAKGLGVRGADTKRSGTPRGQNGSAAGATGSTRSKTKGKK